jgi:membrane protease YdiL (CAAX protease family)
MPSNSHERKMETPVALKRALLFLAEVLGFTLLLQALSAPIWRFLGNGFPAQVAAWLLYGLGAVILAWVFNRLQRRQGMRELGFRYYKSFWTDVWYGLLGYASLYILSLPLDLAALSDRAKMASQIIGWLSPSSTPWILVLSSVLVLTMGFFTGAFHEEIRFRGYYQGVGCQELTPLAGFMIGLIPFSFGHYFAHPDWHAAQVLATILPGIIYGILYYATRSLIVVMTAHTLVNWIGFYPPLVYVVTKSRGSSLVTTAGLGLLFLLLIFLRRNREIRVFVEATGRMCREKPVFGFVTGGLIGLVLLTLWAFRLPAVYSGLAGALLFGISFVGKRALPKADVRSC